ncbi:MAG: hypothetical protein HC785_16815 [Calothrix sp. CSU_2_0]|jgi:hypothetical protein|nr:hypothetical protein [Calothrix sp. CSU_2_0]
MSKLTLHIQQNTNLERVAAILDFFYNRNTDIEQLAATCQLGASVLQKNVFPFLRNLGILDKNNPVRLTHIGTTAAEIQDSNPDLLADFLHLLIYHLHLEEPDRRFSWAYATIVQQLWLRKEVVLSSAEKKSIVAEVIERASGKFELQKSEIAFSESSVAGVLNWLRSLLPTVLLFEDQSEKFSRRYFCTAPLLVKALDMIYKEEQRSYGVKIFLREEVNERLCQMLLLDPSGLDNTLDNAKRAYDYDQGGLFDWGYEGGYGQWVMLTQSPEWTQLLS